jgi:hypothetical protein
MGRVQCLRQQRTLHESHLLGGVTVATAIALADNMEKWKGTLFSSTPPKPRNFHNSSLLWVEQSRRGQ